MLHHGRLAVKDLFDILEGKLVRFCRVRRTEARDIIAFGHWLNDLPLLKCAALGVVPKNAFPEVKAVADYISPYNVDDDFFARELNRLLDEKMNHIPPQSV